MNEIQKIAQDIVPELRLRIDEWLASGMVLGSLEHERLELELWENKIGILRVLERAMVPALPTQEWQDISTAHPSREVWLFTPGRRLGPQCSDDIRFGCPRDWTWATMWMPVQLPAPPVAVIADHHHTEEK